MPMTLLNIVWDISPELFPNTGIPVRWYGILFASGFVVAYFMMLQIFKREAIPRKHLEDLTLYIGIGTVIGARVGHCLFYDPAIYLADPVRILYIWEGGLASHGAAIGILLALWLFTKNKPFRYIELLDKLAVVIPIAGAMVRLGNLANSEIYGKATTLPWGFEFRRSLEIAHRFEPHHPTQIYEALSYTLITLLLWKMYHARKKYPTGFLFGLFLVLLFAMRFLIEFVKEPQVAFEANMALNMGQVLSVPFMVAGILIMVYAGRFRKKTGTEDIDKKLSSEKTTKG
jgi:phosphatidylglycerol---prolipoprotein diacylglyceryl transferase